MERRSFLKSTLAGSPAVMMTQFTQPAVAKAERVTKKSLETTKDQTRITNILWLCPLSQLQ